MAKKEKTFTAKMGHQKVTRAKEKCPVCKVELDPIVYIADTRSTDGHWIARRKNVTVCNCNKKDIYG